MRESASLSPFFLERKITLAPLPPPPPDFPLPSPLCGLLPSVFRFYTANFFPRLRELMTLRTTKPSYTNFRFTPTVFFPPARISATSALTRHPMETCLTPSLPRRPPFFTLTTAVWRTSPLLIGRAKSFDLAKRVGPSLPYDLVVRSFIL